MKRESRQWVKQMPQDVNFMLAVCYEKCHGSRKTWGSHA
jgi:hypothetical protein